MTPESPRPIGAPPSQGPGDPPADASIPYADRLYRTSCRLLAVAGAALLAVVLVAVLSTLV